MEASPFTDNVASYLMQRLFYDTTNEQRTFLASAACFGIQVPFELLAQLLKLPKSSFEVHLMHNPLTCVSEERFLDTC